MQIKILETHKPFVKTYPQHATLFSIIDLDERSLSWIFHNYLLTFIHFHENGGYGVDLCSQYFPWHKLRYPACPMILCRTYDKEVLLSDWPLSDFIISMIDTENYVYFFREVDNNNKHEIFITGYNLDEKKFLCFDFWKGVYQSKWIPFDEIKFNLNPELEADWTVDYLNGIWGIHKTEKYKTENAFYYETVLNFSLQDLIDILEEYIGFKNEVRKILKKDNRELGINVYDIMISMLDIQKHNLVNRPFDLHAFQLLFEHKKLISLAVEKYTDNKEIIERTIFLVEETDKLKNLVMYCNLFIIQQQTYKKYESIIEQIRFIKKIELELFKDIIELYGA